MKGNAMKVPVKGLRETIDPPAGQAFRAICWTRNLREVDSIQPDGARERIGGEGVHWHHHVEMELTHFTAGKGTRFVGDHIGEFDAGDLVLLGSNLPHYWHAPGDSAGTSIQWHFPTVHPIWEFAELSAVRRSFGKAEKGFLLKGRTSARVASLLEGMTGVKAGERLSRLIELFAVLADMPEKDRDILSSRSFGGSGSRHQPAIAAAVRHLVGHFRDEIRTGDLLELTGMSRPTFARQFKEHAGRTMSEFVNKLRLQAACAELLETENSIMEIALNCGFGEISFFNRLFRREKGCSPREFRKRTLSGLP
jgi:AraC-like DNA-binding protein/mannose-6-phosphate isomerase-like protein (cupin superfamily)